MTKIRVGIFFGGASEENPVSIKSAREVARSLDTDIYEPVWVHISPMGIWHLVDGPDADLGAHDLRRVTLSADRATSGLVALDADGWEAIRIDVVLPILHGTLGEDGAIQGLLELAGVPYVGCDIQASAVCMDKSLTYTIAQHAGIQTPVFHVVTVGQSVDPTDFAYPVFVKPARSGSSFGVTKVELPDQLFSAVEAARAFDTKIVVEEAVAGREIGCALLGESADLVTGELDRVALSDGFFRIHQEESPETGSENSSFIVPADISEGERERVLEAAKKVYRALGCRGIARVDLFLSDDGTVILNEVNTMPGLTSYSRYPRMMAAAGITLTDIIDELITHARKGTRP